MTPAEMKAILRERGLCGELTPDGQHVCVLLEGHGHFGTPADQARELLVRMGFEGDDMTPEEIAELANLFARVESLERELDAATKRGRTFELAFWRACDEANVKDSDDFGQLKCALLNIYAMRTEVPK